MSLRLPLADVSDLETRLHAALEDDFASEPLTLYAERIERLLPAVQERLLRYSDEGVHRRGRVIAVRLIAQSDFGVRENEILSALRARLSALTAPLPPLAARRGEIVAIARVIADRLGVDLGIPGARLGEAALEQLAERDAPRNIDELSAAVARALYSSQDAPRESDAPRAPSPPVIAVQRASGGDLSAGAVAATVSPLRSSPSLRPFSASRTPVREPLQTREIEQVVAELAHELKNPMVTIKTFAENLDAIFEDPSLREKFTVLAREAIDRMDGFLEDLLRFSRFAEPEKRLVSLSQALALAVGSLTPPIKDRIHVNGAVGKDQVRGDEAQITFALRSVLRGLCREILEEAPIHVDVSPGGELVFSANAAPGHHESAEGGADSERASAWPNSLDFILADGLVRRHGGSTRVVRQRGQLQIRLSLPGLEASDDG